MTVIFINTKWNVIHGDKRTIYLEKLLKNEETLFPEITVLPIPATRDKIYISDSDILIKDFFSNKLKDSLIFCGSKYSLPDEIIKNYKIYDYSENEMFLLKNAELTAYGTINILCKKSKKPFNDSKILISGFGRVGKNLAKLLLGLDSKVFVLGHKDEDSFWINKFGLSEIKDTNCLNHEFDFIINTVPNLIFSEEKLKNVFCENFIELASVPGIDKQVCEKLNINHISALGIPGKFYPMNAAKIIKESIINILKGDLWKKQN